MDKHCLICGDEIMPLERTTLIHDQEVHVLCHEHYMEELHAPPTIWGVLFITVIAVAVLAVLVYNWM